MTTQAKSMVAPTKEEYAFIGHLKLLLEDSDKSWARAAMAHLRRGLGKPAGTAYEMDKYILSQLPDKAIRYQEEAYYLVASLFAFWHQGKDKAESLEGEWNTDRNLGKSLRALVNEENDSGKKENLEKSTEKRLNALLNSHRDDLWHHLRRITALLRSKDIPVNWVQLLHDLQSWDAENRFVQHAWAKGFWIENKGDDQTDGTAVSNPEENE